MRFLSLLAASALFFAAPALAEETLREQARAQFGAIPLVPPALPYAEASPERLTLGQKLFFDPRLSENQDMSCSTCHNIGMGGVDGRATGHGGQLGGRKVETVLNAAFNASQYWDGRASDLADQVQRSVMVFPAATLRTQGGPIMVTPTQVAATKQHVVDRLKGIPGYVAAFKAAFPAEPEPVTYDNIAKSIAVFEATLITPGAPFDRWLGGDDSAMTEDARQGLALFIGKGCAGCHSGVNFGGAGYAKFGAVQSPGADLLPTDDAGRFTITHVVQDKFVFKIPGLRNVELTAPYFHSDRVADLRQAIAVMGETQLGQKLSTEEIVKIEAFLTALTGKQPEVVLPILPPRSAR